MKRTTFLIAGLLLSFCVAAQSELEDVVYLKNGSVIRGTIIQDQSDGKLKIEILGGTIFAFEANEIDSIRAEKRVKQLAFSQKQPLIFKDSGYKLAFEFGFLIPTQGDGFDQGSAPLLIQSLNGYQFFRQFYIAAGVGIERYGDLGYTFAPLFVGLGGDLLKRQVSPYYFANVGYSFPFAHNLSGNNEESQTGGPMVHAGAGMKVNTRSKVGFTLAVGFKFHKYTSSYEGWNWWLGIPETVTVTERFRRITVTTGFTF